MKKYKEILSEHLSTRQNQLGKVQTSSQDLSSFGAGKQTLSSLSATQAQTPLQTAYASATRLGNAITQYKQGNVKAQKNYFGTNVVGKKLDFLSQELNREVNTICSKSQYSDLTKLGIEMKTLVDQFREQVQNVE